MSRLHPAPAFNPALLPSDFCLLTSAFCRSYLSSLFSYDPALFLAPSSCAGSAHDPSPFFSYYCALFCSMEPTQLLSHQSLPHSFPCNGGWRVPCLTLPLPTVHSPLATMFSFQRLKHCPICNPFILITLQQWGGWGRGFPSRARSQEPRDVPFPNLKLQRQIENCTMTRRRAQTRSGHHLNSRAGKSLGIRSLLGNSTSGNFMELRRQTPLTWANNLHRFHPSTRAGSGVLASMSLPPLFRTIQYRRGLTHVQFQFPQELPRSHFLERTPIVGRNRPGAGLQPQGPEEGPGHLSVNSEIQGHRRSRSPESFRQAGRHRERFRGPRRQPDLGRKRAKIRDPMEILVGKLGNGDRTFRDLRPARRLRQLEPSRNGHLIYQNEIRSPNRSLPFR